MKPYSDNRQSKNEFIRVFDSNVSEEELIWHRDRKDREIVILEGRDWKLQYDNKLPISLEENKVYRIKAGDYHRILKGNGNLILQIRETGE
jgi:hypothetical protein